MKFILSLLLLIVANFASAVATIPGNDPFINTSGSAFGTAFNATDWITFSTNGTPAYVASGDYVEFYGQGFHSTTWNAFPSYNQDFFVRLGVANYHATVGGFADLGLRIYDADGTYTDHLSNIIGSYTFGGAASRDIMSTTSDTGYYNSFQFAQAATLGINYESSLKTFTLGYSYDLGVTATTFRSINIDGGVSNAAADEIVDWGMTDASVFEIAMYMESDSSAPVAGSLLTTVDNFTVVPEPSTYALVTGLFALTFIAFRKNRK
jgi:hypothetical protein